jgi:ion channel-forming bestrophin family protein
MVAFTLPVLFHQRSVRIARVSPSCCDRSRTGHESVEQRKPKESDAVQFFRDIVDTSGTAKFASRDASAVQEAWTRHRSRRRYVRHFLGFPFSKLGRRLFPLSLIPLAESVSLFAYEQMTHTVPHFSSAPISYMSGVVGLLLAFRTNASLARYYEARGSWATIRSRSTDLCRTGMEYINPAALSTGLSTARAGESRGHQLVRYVATFGHVLRSHLQGMDDDVYVMRVRHLVDEDELKLILQSSNRPNAVLQMITHVAGVACDGDMDHHIRYKMDGSVTGMMDAMLTLEKLLRTPIPLSYTRHTSRACLLWCGYVPFSLYEQMGPLGSGIASACITFLLLGVEEIGVAIEDPGAVLPLLEICGSIENDVFQMEETASLLSHSRLEQSPSTRGRWK